MYNAFLAYFSAHPVLAIVFIVLVVVIATFLIVKVMQYIGMGKIRLYAYKWFEEAEDEFLYGENKEKFDYVVRIAKSAVPAPFNLFITEKFMRKTIQLWFDLCKDLLDDGKMNRSTKEETL